MDLDSLHIVVITIYFYVGFKKDKYVISLKLQIKKLSNITTIIHSRSAFA